MPGEREEAGDNNTGATGIQSTVKVEATEPQQYQVSDQHHYIDGLLCHKPGNFPWG